MEKRMNENMENGKENEIRKLMADVETYRQAIQDAKDALESAERELDDVLASEMEKEGGVPVDGEFPFPVEEELEAPFEEDAPTESKPDSIPPEDGKKGKIVPFVMKKRITVRIEKETYSREIEKAKKMLRETEKELDDLIDDRPF